MIREWALLTLVVVTGCGSLAGAPPGDRTLPRIRAWNWAQGRYVFERNCVACHGTMGNGRGETSPWEWCRPSNLTRPGSGSGRPPALSRTDEDLRRSVSRFGHRGRASPRLLLSPTPPDREHITRGHHLSSGPGPGVAGQPTSARPLRLHSPAPPRPDGRIPEARPDNAEGDLEWARAKRAPCRRTPDGGDGPRRQPGTDSRYGAAVADFTTGLQEERLISRRSFRTITRGRNLMPSFGDHAIGWER